MSEELFPIVDENGTVTGSATRRECHGGSMLLHPVVHLHALTPQGDIFLQKRSMTKDIQPGKWDTAVGGHVDYGETTGKAVLREAREELGIDASQARFARRYLFASERERELVNTFIMIVDSDSFRPAIDPVEIDEARFWSREEIDRGIEAGTLTPNFIMEYNEFLRDLDINSL